MFSALREGSVVYILEKSRKGMTCGTAQVTSVSSPQYNISGQFGGTINITVNHNGVSRDFGNLPMGGNVAQYANGATFVSESRDAVIAEVENAVRASEAVLEEDNLNYHKAISSTGGQILASLNPQIAKELALREEVKTLSGRMDGIDGKLDKLFTMLSGGETK